MRYRILTKKVADIIEGVPQTPEVIAPDVDGMTSPKVRYLLNAIVSQDPNSRHLEVGSYKGATLISSMINNFHASALAFEDFSEYSVESDLDKNLSRYRGSMGETRLIKRNFFKEVIPEEMLPITSFFYDGDHSRGSQKAAVLRAVEMCHGALVFMVDDWNWSDVRRGTWDGIGEARVAKFSFWELTARHNWDDAEYHNGVGLFVLSNACPQNSADR